MVLYKLFCEKSLHFLFSVTANNVHVKNFKPVIYNMTVHQVAIIVIESQSHFFPACVLSYLAFSLCDPQWATLLAVGMQVEGITTLFLNKAIFHQKNLLVMQTNTGIICQGKTSTILPGKIYSKYTKYLTKWIFQFQSYV